MLRVKVNYPNLRASSLIQYLSIDTIGVPLALIVMSQWSARGSDSHSLRYVQYFERRFISLVKMLNCNYLNGLMDKHPAF